MDLSTQRRTFLSIDLLWRLEIVGNEFSVYSFFFFYSHGIFNKLPIDGGTDMIKSINFS